MRKLAVSLMALAVLGATVAAPAAAAKKTTTFYLHGRGPVQEAFIAESWLDDMWMTMDQEKPTGSEFSSVFVTNYLRGPNTNCDGNGLLPVWKGNFSGAFKGDAKVTLHTVATPAVNMTVSLYKDPTGTCASNIPGSESEAPQPFATTQVPVAPGHATTEVTFKKVKFKAGASILLQLSIPSMTTPGQVRILFDSSDFASSVQLLPK